MAEQLVLQHNGTVIRLGGLYDEMNGPQAMYSKQIHSVWYEFDNVDTVANVDSVYKVNKGNTGSSSSSGSSCSSNSNNSKNDNKINNKYLNMLHYSDASTLITQCLNSKQIINNKIFIGIDNHPIAIYDIYKNIIKQYIEEYCNRFVINTNKNNKKKKNINNMNNIKFNLYEKMTKY